MIVIASNNKEKIKEIRGILKGTTLKSLDELNVSIDVVEDKDTFEENALKKATEIFNVVKKPVIADDSGLCISCLDNWPGIFTARATGKHNTTSEELCTCILDKLGDSTNREAVATCVMVYYDGVNTVTSKGEVHATISNSPRGNNTFAFDPIFLLSSR